MFIDVNCWGSFYNFFFRKIKTWDRLGQQPFVHVLGVSPPCYGEVLLSLMEPKQVSFQFNCSVLLNFAPSHSALCFASSTGFVNILKWRLRLLVTRLSCMCCKHTHAGIYVLQWREECREDRHPVPSPIFISVLPPPSLICSPLPLPFLPKWVCASWGCAISHPLHWLTWSGGMYET